MRSHYCSSSWFGTISPPKALFSFHSLLHDTNKQVQVQRNRVSKAVKKKKKIEHFSHNYRQFNFRKQPDES